MTINISTLWPDNAKCLVSCHPRLRHARQTLFAKRDPDPPSSEKSVAEEMSTRLVLASPSTDSVNTRLRDASNQIIPAKELSTTEAASTTKDASTEDSKDTTTAATSTTADASSTTGATSAEGRATAGEASSDAAAPSSTDNAATSKGASLMGKIIGVAALLAI
ncbi:acetylxylan esterase precursor [Fusarium agapanthi]|uniref:Acetylxylan esterase n=1 Tax=Fusarium agapanthi TaxID=1803897 RepID=A0A9P5AZX5_9HYPO|nr:acetylxylan esterase precursor [Fusarium agapanthi]